VVVGLNLEKQSTRLLKADRESSENSMRSTWGWARLGYPMVRIGDFTGGRLLYFPDDDARHGLDELRQEHAVPLDTKRGFCLFDGNRAHSVEPFLGERYSVVFFSIGAHSAGPRGDLPREVSYPSQEAIRYFSAYIAGPRGYGVGGRAQSIRRFLGMPEKPQVLWVACPCLGTLPPKCIRDIAALAGARTAVRAASRRFAAAWHVGTARV
jgi:hypothetical protein